VAGAAVGVGIIFEASEYSASTHRVAKWLVIGGVFVESLCTIALFVFDEGISGAQQSKIIALEQRLAPRTLSGSQQEELQNRAAKFPGTLGRIWIIPGDADTFPFSQLLTEPLRKAGWVVGAGTSLSGQRMRGVAVAIRYGADTKPQADMLVGFLNSAGILTRLAAPFENEDGLLPAANMYSPPGADNPQLVVVIGSK
jgi:hypothetical protein